VTELRELRADDAQRVAELFAEAFGDARRLDAEEIRSWLASTTLRPEWLRVLEDDGEVDAAADLVTARKQHERSSGLGASRHVAADRLRHRLAVDEVDSIQFKSQGVTGDNPALDDRHIER